MGLSTGIRIGSYEIKSPLGEGGMGVVYRAHDTKLGRDVAIKALPDVFASDSDRLQRFQREAQVLASLNHPNIAHIYGLEEAEKTQCIVMELVEGETLQERLKRGPIPVDQALPIAKQIAEALEAAHERGIIHRDLKPGNVMLSRDGKVKVLDFGLAKAYETDAGKPALSHSPTVVSIGATNAGIILGTAAYMSPEQARGMPIDRRTDIFAFGAVLYETLTGQPVFQGEMVSDILASVLKVEPDWTRLPTDTPAAIHKLLRRCLQKDRNRRLDSAAGIRIEIDEAHNEPEPKQSLSIPVFPAPGRLPWLLVAGVTAIALTLAVPAIKHILENPPAAPEMRLEINTPPSAAPLEFTLSPDGRYIVFPAADKGIQQLWLRALDKTDAQPIAGTQDARAPFWSADSRSIGFFSSGRLKRVDIAGGAPQILTTSTSQQRGTWNATGTIIFRVPQANALARIAASGGEPVLLTKLAPGQDGHAQPSFLPDGNHFLFLALGKPEAAGIYLGSLDGTEPKRLGAADSAAAYLSPNMILFIRGTTLMAQHLDMKRWELTGDPVRIADPVGIQNFLGLGGFSVSADGRMAYRTGGPPMHQLKWYDRTGKLLGTVGEPDINIDPAYPELSPDGTRVALQRNVQNNTDIWISDLTRGTMTRFTFNAFRDTSPVWSPDGTRIAFTSDTEARNVGNLLMKLASGVGTPESLLENQDTKISLDWSRDGRYLLYYDVDLKGNGRDLWALPLTGTDRKPIVIANTPFEEIHGQFSPDGRWVAYSTNESGRFEVVVQPFPTPTGKWQVSTSGGSYPRWSSNGKELYFVSQDAKLMAASISTGVVFQPATPVPLFQVVTANANALNAKAPYAVSHDGRFLIDQPLEGTATAPITVLLNWHPPKE